MSKKGQFSTKLKLSSENLAKLPGIEDTNVDFIIPSEARILALNWSPQCILQAEEASILHRKYLK